MPAHMSATPAPADAPARTAFARSLPLRTLDVLDALCGFAASGATNGELAQTTRCTPSQVPSPKQLAQRFRGPAAIEDRKSVV